MWNICIFNYNILPTLKVTLLCLIKLVNECLSIINSVYIALKHNKLDSTGNCYKIL